MGKYYVYNGQVYNSDELQHWKYVKRIKKNGKWSYVYDNKNEATTGKNNAPKDNQGYVDTTGKNNAPKDNQGAAGLSKSPDGKVIGYGNAPKNNQGYVDTTGKNNTPKNNQGVVIGKTNAPKYNQGVAPVKDTAPKYNQGVAGLNKTYTIGNGWDSVSYNPVAQEANKKKDSKKKTVKNVSDFASSSVSKGKSLVENLMKKLKK